MAPPDDRRNGATPGIAVKAPPGGPEPKIGVRFSSLAWRQGVSGTSRRERRARLTPAKRAERRELRPDAVADHFLLHACGGRPGRGRSRGM